MRKSAKFIGVVAAAALLLTGCGTGEDVDKDLTPAQAAEKLDALMKDVRADEVTHGPDNSWVGADETIQLPDIDVKYPLSVEGDAPLNVEIFSSTEKAGKSGDKWLDVQAREFNRTHDDVSVSIRPIASGLAVEYIASGQHVPGAFTPSNTLWASILEARGVRMDQVSAGLTGNTAGFLLKPEVAADLGSGVTPEDVIDAVVSGEVTLASTDPNVSSTGLNALVTILRHFDEANPLSDAARDGLVRVAAKTPPVSPTTAETVMLASKGLANVILSEHQSWKSDPTLADWTFIPFGERHDSPLYATGVSEPERQVLAQFAEFLTSQDAQTAATRLGFNPSGGYAGVDYGLDGAQLTSALATWKQTKDAGRTVLSVFVADRSGSMEGLPLARLQESLRTGARFISADYHVGLISYSTDITVDLPLAPFDDQQHSLFQGAVNSLQAGGGTATNDALLAAMKMLTDAAPQYDNPALRIFLLSDGETNEGYSLDRVASVIDGLNVPVYTIGYNANVEELTAISSMNEAYFTSADSDDVISKIKELFTAQL